MKRRKAELTRLCRYVRIYKTAKISYVAHLGSYVLHPGEKLGHRHSIIEEKEIMLFFWGYEKPKKQ